MEPRVPYSKAEVQPPFTLIQVVNIRQILIAMILVSIFIISHYIVP